MLVKISYTQIHLVFIFDALKSFPFQVSNYVKVNYLKYFPFLNTECKFL